MASLSDTLKKNTQAKQLVRGPGGVLTEQTQEETQTLASKMGLQAPPTTPGGVAMIGGNADQQKMAGTPAQKDAALSLASQPVDQSLSGALRRQQVRSQATQQEQQGIQKSQDLENLGSLGDRVNSFIGAQMAKLESQAGKGVEVKSVEQFQGKDTKSIKDLLQQLRANPTDQQVMLQVNQALGYDIKTQLSPAQVDDLYEGAVSAISRGAAGNVDDDLNVDDLVQIADFGYDKATLSGLLGVPENELSKFTVGQLRDRVNQLAEEEFSNVQQFEQQATSGMLGQAERGAARAAARESSRVGTRASEKDVANLEQQIANADQVTFAGRNYNVDELLRDETISGLVKEFMDSGPDSELAQAIQKNEPGLFNFIQKNKAVLDDASRQMQTGAQTFQDTQTYNRNLTNIGGVKLDDKIGQALIPQAFQLAAGKADRSKIPLIAYLDSSGIPAEQHAAIANTLNTTVAQFPESVEDLQGVSADGWKTLNPAGGENSQFGKVVNNKKQRFTFSNLDPANVDSLVSQIFDNVSSGADVQKVLTTGRVQAVLGIGSAQAMELLDADGDGRMDDGAAIKQRLLDSIPAVSFQQASTGAQVPLFTKQQLQQPGQLTGGAKEAADALGQLALDGSIDANDLRGVRDSVSFDALFYLQDNKGKGKIDYDYLDQMVASRKRDYTMDFLNKSDSETGALDTGGSPDEQAGRVQSQIKMLEERLAQNDRRDDRPNLEATLNARRLRLEALSGQSQAARDAVGQEKTRKREREQDQWRTILTGGAWQVLPPEAQDKLIDLGNQLGERGMKELMSTWQWDGNKTGPENLAVLGRNITTLAPRLSGGAAELIAKATPGFVGATVGGVARQAVEAISSPGTAVKNVAKKVRF